MSKTTHSSSYSMQVQITNLNDHLLGKPNIGQFSFQCNTWIRPKVLRAEPKMLRLQLREHQWQKSTSPAAGCWHMIPSHHVYSKHSRFKHVLNVSSCWIDYHCPYKSPAVPLQVIRNWNVCCDRRLLQPPMPFGGRRLATSESPGGKQDP